MFAVLPMLWQIAMSVRAMSIRKARWNDWSGTAVHLAHRDVKQEDGGLKDIQSDHGFDHVLACDNDVKTRHHQEDHDPIVVQSDDLFDAHTIFFLPAKV